MAPFEVRTPRRVISVEPLPGRLEIRTVASSCSGAGGGGTGRARTFSVTA